MLSPGGGVVGEAAYRADAVFFPGTDLSVETAQKKEAKGETTWGDN